MTGTARALIEAPESTPSAALDANSVGMVA
jgi:hypothetical protein